MTILADLLSHANVFCTDVSQVSYLLFTVLLTVKKFKEALVCFLV